MLRCAREDDAEDLAEVHIATWRAGYADVFPAAFLESLDHDRRATWWRRLLHGGARVHVAVVGERVVGFCHPGPADDKGWGEIFAIYVHPDHWGRGHGRALLLAGEETLRSTGFDRALLWVLEQNQRGRRFYERQGWVVGKPFRLEEIGGVQVEEVRYETAL